MLSGSNTLGTYTSKVFDAGLEVGWNEFNWAEELPYGEALPDNNVIETGANMSGNLLLLHLDEASGTLSDTSGSNNDGNNVGATYGVSGKLGDALSFNGDDRVEISESTSLALTSQVSYGSWFKINSLSTYAGIMSRMRTWPDGYNLQVGTSNRIACGWGVYTISNDVPVIGQWYHAVCVYDGTNMKLYVNGVLQTDIDSGTLTAGTDDLKLGVFYTTNSLYFDGVIDEVFVFNRALSSNEVLDFYKRGALRLNAVVRSCDDASCSGESWSSELNDNKNTLNVNDNQYFQYHFNFLTDDSTYSPILNNVTINYEIQ